MWKLPVFTIWIQLTDFVFDIVSNAVYSFKLFNFHLLSDEASLKPMAITLGHIGWEYLYFMYMHDHHAMLHVYKNN